MAEPHFEKEAEAKLKMAYIYKKRGWSRVRAVIIFLWDSAAYDLISRVLHYPKEK